MISAEDDYGLTPFEYLVRHHVQQVKSGRINDASLAQCYLMLRDRHASVMLKSFNGKHIIEVFFERIPENSELL